MNRLLILCSISLILPLNAGVLKSSEERPISHSGALCGEHKCPDNQRCEMPISCDSEDEDCSQVEPRCVSIPPPIPKCKDNEELKLCGSQCEPSCDQSEDIICTEACLTNVCQCKDGFVRDSSGNCRAKEDCDKCLLECPNGTNCEKVDTNCENESCKQVEVCAIPARDAPIQEQE